MARLGFEHKFDDMYYFELNQVFHILWIHYTLKVIMKFLWKFVDSMEFYHILGIFLTITCLILPLTHPLALYPKTNRDFLYLKKMVLST